jgi:hypothetical protein
MAKHRKNRKVQKETKDLIEEGIVEAVERSCGGDDDWFYEPDDPWEC